MDYELDPFMEDFDEDERVCLKCLHDAGLRKAFFRSPGKNPGPCSFCREEDGETIPALEIQKLIKIRCLNGKNEAGNELPYCSAEGGFIGETYESCDVLDAHTLYAMGDELYDALEQRLNIGSLFCDWQHGMPRPAVQWKYGWSGFVDAVKHGSRFFFGERKHEPRDEFDPTEISPNDFLRRYIPDGIQKLKAVQTLPKGTILYRCRITESHELVTDFSQIGPPPVSDSVGSNRFSPPGIVMLYAGSTASVAAIEIGWPCPDGFPEKLIHTGKLRTLRDLTVLDFTNLAYPAGSFDPDWLDDYHIAEFFKEFIGDLSAPVSEQRKPLDYVPTQVLCEYFRFFGAKSDGISHRLDGIIYPSSHDGTPCYVFFWDNDLASENLQLLNITSETSVLHSTMASALAQHFFASEE